jgi:hypothetical protein
MVDAGGARQDRSGARRRVGENARLGGRRCEYAKKRGCCQFVKAGAISRRIAQRSPAARLFWRRERQLCGESPGFTCASTGRSSSRSR